MVYSQFIIPASDLSCFQENDQIVSLTFYLQTTSDYGEDIGKPNWEQEGLGFDIGLMEIDQSAFEYNEDYLYSLFENNEMMPVNLVITDLGSVCMVKFEGLWHYYQGGNLLVQVTPYQILSDYECSWIGAYSTEGNMTSAYSQYQGEDWGYYTYAEAFRPKVTIEYYGEQMPPCQKPIHCFVDSVSLHSAWLNWIPSGNETQWEVACSDNEYAEEWEIAFTPADSHPFEITGLKSYTYYTAWVRSVCDDGDYSGTKKVSFWTDAIAAPENLSAINVETEDATSVDLIWQYEDHDAYPSYWDIAITMDWDASPDDLDFVTINNTITSGVDFSYHLTGLEPFTKYKAWVRANYGSDEVGPWSDFCYLRPVGLEYFMVSTPITGSGSSTTVPFAQNTSYPGSRSQFIIPASILTDMVGGKLWKLWFMCSPGHLPANSVDVYVTEIEEVGFTETAYYDWNDMERVVYRGTATMSDGKVEFDHPYTYRGGNLLVGVVCHYCYYSSQHRWYGSKTSYYSSVSGTGTVASNLNKYLPTTSFYYIPVSSDTVVIDSTMVVCDEAFLNGHVYNESGTYYDTINTLMGRDTIVALHLTVNHSYYDTLQVTACDSYFWEDQLYTSSCMDSRHYQTEHGCDSVLTLQLMVHSSDHDELFATACGSYDWEGNHYVESGDYEVVYPNQYSCDSTIMLHLTIHPILPLGDFSYLSPLDGHLFHENSADFSWNEIENALEYDFYLWEEGMDRPETPTVPSLTSTQYHADGLTYDVTYRWCVVAKNQCAETESVVNTFSCQWTPVLTVVPHGSIEFGEVELGQSATKTIAIAGSLLVEDISFSFLDNSYGADANCFEVEVSQWHPRSGGLMHIKFTPDATHLSYNAALRIASSSLADTLYLAGLLADRYVFETHVDGDVYSANDEITIYGHVEDVLGNPQANLEVEVYFNVMGSRYAYPLISDQQGNYQVVYHPTYSESGYYQVGSCLRGALGGEAHDAFDIPGMSLTKNDFIVWELEQNDTLTGSISIRNRSRLPLTNLHVTPVSLPAGCEISFTDLSLDGLATGDLSYVVTGSEVTLSTNYEQASFVISSDEGVSLSLSCYYYCREGRGVLGVYPPSIITSMTRRSHKTISLQLYNNGTEETGPVVVGMPEVEWMSLMGGDTLPSLMVGDSCNITILLHPDANESITQFNGTIAVNCTNGVGIEVPYVIESTSDSTGDLVVDVTDDYTYNTNGGNGPHLANAQVTLTGYYSLETVAQGVTDENGLFTVDDLPEGYYIINIQAKSHSEYNRGILYVEAGKTNHYEYYLQFQAISYSWMVVPTEIEDAYDFELVCDIKTNVPVPVVTIVMPEVIDSLAYGDTLVFNIAVTNYGLIDAYETQLTMPHGAEYAFYPLYDFIDTLRAKETVVIPCTMTRTQLNRDETDGCNRLFMESKSWYHCNNERQWVHHVAQVPVFQLCIPMPTLNLPVDLSIGGPAPTFPWTIHLPYPNGYSLPPLPVPDFHFTTKPSQNIPVVAEPDKDCTPCWKVALSTLAHFINLGLGGKYSAISPIVDGLDCMLFNDSIFSNGILSYGRELIGCVTPGIVTEAIGNAVSSGVGESVAHGVNQGWLPESINPEGVTEGLKTTFDALNAVKEIIDMAQRVRECITLNPITREVEASDVLDQLENSARYYLSFMDYLTSMFKEDEWLQEQRLDLFLENFQTVMDPSDESISPQAAQLLMDINEFEYVSDSLIQCLVDRWNRSVQYWDEGIFTLDDLPEGYETDFIQRDSTIFDPAIQALETTELYGFGSVREMFESSLQSLRELAVEHTNDVCAKVSVSFKQTMAMTREAFEGTLKIYNGHDSDPMENVRMDLVIKDENGVDCTSLFQVNVGSLDQITGVDGTGTVQAQQEGMVRLVMIPTVAAAPTTPKVYSFGGSFSFLDPFSGEEMTYPLYPVELTVNPSPELHVDYFIQRHIISDDPLTEDTIEATEPAELAMMIRNVGMGTAKNVYLESSQPEVIDNQNGLLIQFDMVGSSMNGEARPMGLTDIPFGNLLPQSAGIAEWYFTSTLMARVLRSTPHFIHNNSYGNPDLSLVTEVHSHELIKAVRAYGALEDEINDFLVNEEPDFNHVPDRIYFSHGGMVPVKQTLDITAEGTLTPDQRTVQLHLNPAETGWNYAEVDDPAQGQYAIVRCIRDDGQEIPLNNVWITHVTMFDDDAPIHENKLHIVDTLAELRSFTYNVEYAVDSAADAETSLHIDLSTGWNWFSTYLECTPTSLTELEDALSELSGTAVVKSQHSFVTFESEVWNGSIDYNNEEMFMINVGLDCGLSLTGSCAITANHPVTLSCGWNWIGYPVQQEMGLEEALSQLSPTEGDVIKSQSVFSSYSAQDGWSGSLDHLTPGRGYMYLNRSSEANTLLYPSAAKGTVDHRALTTHWKHDEHRYATNLSMMVTLDAMEFALSADAYEIGAFVDGDCRGSARLQQVGDRYVAFLSVSGEKGETVHFRLYDVLREEEYAAMAEEHVVYEPDAVLGAVKSPMVLHFTQTGVEEQADSLRLFPNPTGGQFTVSGTSLRAVRVYDMMGQLLLDLSCGNADQAMVDLSGFSAGVYTVSVLLANGQMLNKLVVKD